MNRDTKGKAEVNVISNSDVLLIVPECDADVARVYISDFPITVISLEDLCGTHNNDRSSRKTLSVVERAPLFIGCAYSSEEGLVSVTSKKADLSLLCGLIGYDVFKLSSKSDRSFFGWLITRLVHLSKLAMSDVSVTRRALALNRIEHEELVSRFASLELMCSQISPKRIQKLVLPPERSNVTITGQESPREYFQKYDVLASGTSSLVFEIDRVSLSERAVLEIALYCGAADGDPIHTWMFDKSTLLPGKLRAHLPKALETYKLGLAVRLKFTAPPTDYIVCKMSIRSPFDELNLKCYDRIFDAPLATEIWSCVPGTPIAIFQRTMSTMKPEFNFLSRSKCLPRKESG